MLTNTIIEANNISKSYLVQGKKKHVFQNLSIEIKAGERIALMGRNGAGKSTLLRILCGIEKPNTGTVTVAGRLSWPIGVADNFIPNLTGKENVKFVCRLYSLSKEQTNEAVSFVREFSDLHHDFDMPMQTYSSGMRSRLAFSLCMAFDFDFYIVDEAFAVGDTAFKDKCLDAFHKRAKNKGIIMVSHGINIIREFCTSGILLHDQMTQSNNLDEIIEIYQSTSAFVPS